MAVTVRIPTPLRKFTDGKEQVHVEGSDVRGVLEALGAAHPGLKERILDDSGAPRRFVNIYYQSEDIRFLQGIDTSVAEGAELSIVPAIAGG